MSEPVNPDSLFALFTELPDPRSDRNKLYALEEILFVVLAGMLSGMNHLTEIEDFAVEKLDWFRRILPFEFGIPSHDTMGRVLSMLCPDAVELMFEQWMSSVSRTKGVVAMDGKTVRGTASKNGSSPLVHIVSGFASANGVVLGQLRANKKSNEVTAILRLLESLVLSGAVIPIDAAGCQTEIMDTVVERKVDFIIAVKGNQPTLYRDLAVAFQDVYRGDMEVSQAETEERGHGRDEWRKAEVISAGSILSDPEKWKSVIRMTSKRHVGGKRTASTRYYASSLAKLDGPTALHHIRDHWSIENRLHWWLDTPFREDECRCRAENLAENLVVIRHVVLNLLRSATHLKSGIAGRRLRCGYSDATREKLITGFPR